MRFYVPEWDDRVDPHYDFIMDEHSNLNPDERENAYIWDIFSQETVPIDGVLISREQVEQKSEKTARILNYGVYEDPVLRLPDWMPTISDCGAWGYKWLPFPPYENEEMLEFYEELGVTTGVTIDHLVFGSGREGRLYLDENAFADGVSVNSIPNGLEESVDVRINEWPDWPDYVEKYEPKLTEDARTSPLTGDDFEGTPSEILKNLDAHPAAVFRTDDTQFRYELTLENAEKMRTAHKNGDYSYRLMAAIQGSSPEEYVDAAEQVLELGYDYIGIGGVAGSTVTEVREIVAAVGNEIASYERQNETRIDFHVFGFAKPNAFDEVGRRGVSSFDSASMLRAAWTGGDNYHLSRKERYDAIRVRYPSGRDGLQSSIETGLRGQILLRSLRAFSRREPIPATIRDWESSVYASLPALETYLEAERHSDAYEAERLRDLETHFRQDFDQAALVAVSFGGPFLSQILKLLRRDSAEAPISFDKYSKLVETANTVLNALPAYASQIEATADETSQLKQIWTILSDYVTFVGDEELLEDYQLLLQNRPWEECDCPICREYGIEVAIFRGNNRNRRRGFHNTRVFYDTFEKELPKILVVCMVSETPDEEVESFLKTEYPEWWSVIHDLPVAEVGVLSPTGIDEWWRKGDEKAPGSPPKTDDKRLLEGRYTEVFAFGPENSTPDIEAIPVHCYDEPRSLRNDVLDTLGYDERFNPTDLTQTGLTDF